MATLQIHSRSISLPARLHPVSPASFDHQVDLQISKSWQVSKTVTSEGIQSGLLGLAELYNSVQELAQPRRDLKSIEESLSGSVELLDSCTAIRELFQMIRENVQTLQSALRRKGLDSSVQSDISSYFCFRKKMNKCVAKALKALKNFESRNGDSGFDNVFREVAGVTVAIFRSILVFLSSPTTARSGGWSLVSRLVQAKPVAENGVENEVGSVDFALSSLQGKLRSNGDKAVEVQKRLQNLEAVVEGFEGGLERVFRQLVQSRVTLLNILTDH
ncbi:hypothetical protein Salat_1247100 [Sesamum alatum]|uniref:DUF241 domain protein n=1 Tax=Sesamum alatum TaxID=300844 RepID=A0AAE1YGJ3_9LAMI|nr:hypothetical protein Salat_1247100 [Sesamum alatum]